MAAPAAGPEVGGTGGDHRREASDKRKPGCHARNRWYPEGAIIDLQQLKGVQSLSVTPVLFVCRNGRWINAS